MHSEIWMFLQNPLISIHNSWTIPVFCNDILNRLCMKRGLRHLYNRWAQKVPEKLLAHWESNVNKQQFRPPSYGKYHSSHQSWHAIGFSWLCAFNLSVVLLHQNPLNMGLLYYYMQKTALKEHFKVAKLVVPKLVPT